MDPLSHRRAGAASAAILSMKMAAHAQAKAASQKTQQKRAEAAAAAANSRTRPKPRRPPSAYSLFFKQERKKLLGTDKKAGDDSANGLLDRIIANGGGLGRSNGNASSDDEGKKPSPAAEQSSKAAAMNELAKTISRKWKALDESSRSVFEALALLEKKKYERETEIWNRERRVEEERLAGKFGTKAFKKEMASGTNGAAAKRKREEGAFTTDKKTKKAKSSAAAVEASAAEPLKSKQILPHMLGHGRRRFGVPKHVMERAFSKSVGQNRRGSSGNGLSGKKKSNKPSPPSQPRFGVPTKAFERGQQQRTNQKKGLVEEPDEKKPGSTVGRFAVPKSVLQREELRAARMKALSKQPPKAEESVPKADKAQREKKDVQQQQPTLLPSIAAILGTTSGIATDHTQSRQVREESAIDSFDSAFKMTVLQMGAPPTQPSSEAAASQPQPATIPPQQAQTEERAMDSFESAFDETALLMGTSPPQPLSEAAHSQPESTSMDAIASAMELVRPLSGSGDAPAASALHAQAASASKALRMAEEATSFSLDTDDTSKLLSSGSSYSQHPIMDAFPSSSCDMLMLQRTIQSGCQPPARLCQDKFASPSQDEDKSSTTATVTSIEGDFSWAEDDLVEPTPLGSTAASSPEVEVEKELNMSIANIFGAANPGDGTELKASTENVTDIFEASGVEAFPEATCKLDSSTTAAQAADTVEPNCIAQLQLRAQAALSNGNNILSLPAAEPTVNQDVGDDDSPLDKNSIDFLMTVFN